MSRRALPGTRDYLGEGRQNPGLLRASTHLHGVGVVYRMCGKQPPDDECSLAIRHAEEVMMKRTLLAFGIAALAGTAWSQPGWALSGINGQTTNGLSQNGSGTNGAGPNDAAVNGAAVSGLSLRAVRLALPDGIEVTFH
jgi:hypothetical protein